MAQRGEDAAAEFYANLQVYGTPDQCIDKIAERRDILGADTFLGFFSYGGMDWDEVMRNLHLFTDKVAPRVKAL
jgi:alkanesulfonate monooxygenase SsuD/methylene tetrahydromethanopterin reductase-like flavin-dependent oxidoreductase (luciferase family)